MQLLEIQTPPIIGEFNTNYFVRIGEQPCLMRIPKRNEDLFQNILDEYRAIGFTGIGGRVRRRSPQEQYVHGRKAAMDGLRVVPPLSFEHGMIIYPYLEGAQRLDHYLKDHGDKSGLVMQELVTDLRRAHRLGYVYGDRWSGNILVDQRYGMLHVDFDLEISGPYAPELDVAQVVYHSLWAGREKTFPYLLTLLSRNDHWFDQRVFLHFLGGLSRYFEKTHVGGIERETGVFIELLKGGLLVGPGSAYDSGGHI